jgi:2-succinyl-6-hydroxy-2,4-cyclohexadiene-1-carboxylate synthase
MNRTPIRFHYVQAGDPGHPAMVFLHGFLGDHLDWQQIMSAFSRHFFCIAPDLPGHGRTAAGTRLDSYRMPDCAAQLCGLLENLGISRSHLVGYSMGGRLALYLLSHFPHRWVSGIIESASPGLATADQRRQRREQDRQLARQIASTAIEPFIDWWYSQPLFATIRAAPEFADTRRRRLKNDPAGLARSLLAMGTGSQPPLWEDLSRIQVPLLAVVGEHDEKFKAIAAGMAAACPALSTAVVAGAGHNVHIEAPAAFVAVIERFLSADTPM